MKTHKISNHIMLSGITVSLLFSPSMALPSGGKFTHGTSGSININGNNMNIMGNGTNSVIQWGGGFNIGKSEQVNFNGSNKNYLNIAHGANKSTIEGVLNASGNNVFLINPNGVIITKTGTINANRFVASTASMSDTDMKNFANGNLDYNTFSPVFKPNSGNVVNLGGEITAQSVTFQGNKVLSNAYSDFDQDTENHPKKISASEINLQGNEIYVDVSSINATALNKINIKGSENNNFKGSMYLNAMGYYYNPYSYLVFDKYTDSNSNNNFKVYKYVGIGSDLDWWHFAKGWNENKEGFRSTAGEYRLTNDIDFKGDKGQNYASYWIDLNGDGLRQDSEYTTMIVGLDYYNSPFKKTFNGQGFTLKNINIDTTVEEIKDKPKYVGIFGASNYASFKNVNVDYKSGEIKTDLASYVGGLVGKLSYGIHENISIKNINKIDSKNGLFVGGYAGDIWGGGTFRNIYLDNIGSITNNYNHVDPGRDEKISIGGFAGRAYDGTYSNIYINEIGNISTTTSKFNVASGGFAGVAEGSFSNIYLSNIDNIEALSTLEYNYYRTSSSGGFAGELRSRSKNLYNIYINSIGNINASFTKMAEDSKHGISYAGGFIGKLDLYVKGTQDSVHNIFLNDIETVTAKTLGSFSHIYTGGFIGQMSVAYDYYSSGKRNFSDIYLNQIGTISGVGEHAEIGGFLGEINYFSGEFSNISINNIENIKGNSHDANIGGFVGSNGIGKDGFLKNIELNNIANIEGYDDKTYGYNNIGGFAGSIENNSNYENIILNNIDSISSNAYSARIGGFSGSTNGNFKNIVLNNIKKIEANGGWSYASGFALSKGEGNYENIFIYFDKGAVINGIKGKGKFFANSNSNSKEVNNVHIYHDANDLTNAITDEDYWGDANTQIQIHAYNDSNKDQAYNEFQVQASAVARPVLPIMPSPSIPSISSGDKDHILSVEDVLNEEVVLDKDDLLDEEVLEQIINDLKSYYVVDVHTLNDLLKAYAQIDENNPESKAEFLANYLLSKDKYPDEIRLQKAHSMIQSLDFLLAYANNNASDSKLTAEAQVLYDSLKSVAGDKATQANANKDKINNFIQTTLKNQVGQINSANENFNKQNYDKQIDALAKAYNEYIQLIDKGLVSKEDQVFKEVSDKLFNLISKSQDETKTIKEFVASFNSTKEQVNEKFGEYFFIKGDLRAANVAYPILYPIGDSDGNEVDKPLDPIEPPVDKPDDSLVFEQSSTFNSVGDEALSEEEKKEELEAAALRQKNRTCIVSDNFKSMNPCVVEGI
ncbi:filamentous hemagglutinin N-terminal domain-containing protein [Campylobacter coli]